MAHFCYLFGLLAEEGINIVDAITTYTELNIIVIDTDDAIAYNILQKAVKHSQSATENS